jgi:branched-chain amino acid transport system permease protein
VSDDGSYGDLAAQLFASGLLTGAQYAGLAVSIGLIYSTTKTFHFAHSVTYAVGAFAAVVAATRLGFPPILVAAAAAMIAAAFGVLTETVLYRPLRNRGVSNMGIFLASLGLATAGPNILQILFGAGQRAVPGWSSKTLNVGSVTFTSVQLVLALAMGVLMAAVLYFLNRTRAGQAVLATRSNIDLAGTMGIPVRGVYLGVFAVGSALMGLLAYFSAAQFGASPTMGLQPLLYGFIAMFLGGIDRPLGWIVGGFALAFISLGVGYFFTQTIGLIAVFALLIAVLVWRPTGLLAVRTA